MAASCPATLPAEVGRVTPLALATRLMSPVPPWVSTVSLHVPCTRVTPPTSTFTVPLGCVTPTAPMLEASWLMS